MGRTEAGMLMPPSYERARTKEKNAGIRGLSVVRNTRDADQNVTGEAVLPALKHDVHRSRKIGFCYHC